MIKHILILLGSIFLGLGFIGIIIPGLPTAQNTKYQRCSDHSIPA